MKIKFLKSILRDFPGGPVVKTSPSNAGVAGSIPGQGAKMPQKNQNIKQKQYCNKFSRDFKNGPHQKKKKKVYLSCLLLFKEEQFRLLLIYQPISVPSFFGEWNDVANCYVLLVYFFFSSRISAWFV